MVANGLNNFVKGKNPGFLPTKGKRYGYGLNIFVKDIDPTGYIYNDEPVGEKPACSPFLGGRIIMIHLAAEECTNYLNFAQTNGSLLKGEDGSQSGLDVPGERIG